MAALERWARELTGPRQARALDEMELEIEDMRAAWEWATARADVDALDRAMDGLALFGRYGHPATDVSLFRSAARRLAELKSSHALRVRARAMLWESRSAGAGGESFGPLAREGLCLLEELERCGQDVRREQAIAYTLLGTEAAQGGRVDEACRLYERSLALSEAAGDRYWMGEVTASLGVLARRAGAYAQARQWFERCVAIGREMGNPTRVTVSLFSLGLLALHQGRLSEIEDLVRENLAFIQGEGWLVVGTFLLLLCEGAKFAEAHALFSELLAACQEKGSGDAAFIGGYVGFTQVHLGLYSEARASAEAALALCRGFGHPFAPAQSLRVLGMAWLAEGAVEEARRLLEESVVAYRQAGWPGLAGWALGPLACAERGLGQYARAREHLHEALCTRDEGDEFLLWHVLPAVALFLVDEGEIERAVELYSLAARYPFVGQSRWFEDVAGKEIAAAATESLLPDAIAAAQERGRARDLLETGRELAAELGGTESLET